MHTVNEAKDLVKKNTTALSPIVQRLESSPGCVLAEDLYAGNNFPPFAQSAMDGYAFSFDDLANSQVFLVSGESAAGAAFQKQAGSKEAVRIFTGAPLPANTDTVVMQEKVRLENNTIFIEDNLLEKGSNVRPLGSEIQKGELALEKGTVLTPAALGLLASLGFKEIPVVPKPRIAIIVTGKELQEPGKPLAFGQVYESNSFTLRAALQQLGMPPSNIKMVDDNLPALQHLLAETFLKHDLVLITGGISAGDYDYVSRALDLCGVKTIFYKVKQKPGKPLYFGRKENCLVFGLPGNPSSVLTCFYEYVLNALQYLTGQAQEFIEKYELKLLKPYSKKPGMTHFLKGLIEKDGVWPLEAQESYRLVSFARADCLIVLDEDKTDFKLNDLVTVHRLPR